MLALDTAILETGLIRSDKKTLEALSKLGLLTVGDLLRHYPRRHEDRSHFDAFPENPTAHPVCLHVEVVDSQARFGRGKARRIFEASVEPAESFNVLGNRLVLRWFNLAYIQKMIAVGQRLVIFGQPKMSGKRLVLDHPDFEVVEDDPTAAEAHMGRIVPVYALTSGINQKSLRGLAHKVLDLIEDEVVPDWLPPDSEKSGLSRLEAIRTVHYPATFKALEPARRYLALEEFSQLQLILQKRKLDLQAKGGIASDASGNLFQTLLGQLPFQPTNAQLRASNEIVSDMSRPVPMVRLLQGDVGAGKTLVAAAAILQAIESGRDAVLMAPTQILAEQHFDTFQSWLEPMGVEVKLRTGTKEVGGDLPLFSDLSGSELGSLTVGTHALIHDRSHFEKGLGLAVVDEQHKFGVAQRQRLIDRGDAPDVLVMTATPIPRTLALSFYGDLDVSILDEMPPGRGKLITGIRLASQTEDAARFIREQVGKGRQAYIVYPLIDESDKVAARAATAEVEDWSKRLPGIRLSLMHGRMTADEKEIVMDEFRRGEVQVLVSTTVIEVGVDVPNANVMLIYSAERFGLAQIHQLRGRIGRGEHKSFCVLMLSPECEEARGRLEILEKTRDGFLIAEEDLKQRGPGEMLGTQQSGLPDLKFADFLGDFGLVERAREIATEMLVQEDQ
ncbi:MAG: ATP-dependent DNA helicase RecG [Verrucomicrobiota bacterium]